MYMVETYCMENRLLTIKTICKFTATVNTDWIALELSVVILSKPGCFNLQICLKCWIKMYNGSKSTCLLISYMWNQFYMPRKDDETTNYVNITFMNMRLCIHKFLFCQVLAALQNWLACQGKTVVQEYLCCHSVSPHL